LEGESLHISPSSGKKRPFFSPLVYHSKRMGIFRNFLLSGTGINFALIKELMESSVMKLNPAISYEVVSDFQPLSKSQVISFATQFLKDQQVLKVDEIVARISNFELCHGRPRFLAYILDRYMETKEIDVAICGFVADISNVNGQSFPLKFFKRDLDNNIRSLDRTIAGDSLGKIIRDGLLEVILTGKFLFTVDDNTGEAAIRYGLGFGVVMRGYLTGIQIQEQAIVECLRYFIPFADIAKTLAERLVKCPKPQMVGYLLEYLVAFALVANTSGDDIVNKIGVWKGFPYQYLRDGDCSQVCFPDHMCGPDIIYKCTKTKTVFIVQVKFVKSISKQEIANACDTTDPKRFYCKRNGNVVLKGFEADGTQLLESLRALQENGYSLQQLLFIHSGGTTSGYTRDAAIINSENSSAFFDKIGPGIWELLDSLRKNFSK